MLEKSNIFYFNIIENKNVLINSIFDKKSLDIKSQFIYDGEFYNIKKI